MTYRFLTIIFWFSWDHSETQMVAFYQRSFGTQLINWNKNATIGLDLLYPTCPILPYPIPDTDPELDFSELRSGKTGQHCFAKHYCFFLKSGM